MAKIKATTFSRLSINRQVRFLSKVQNFTDLTVLVQSLLKVDPIISFDNSNRYRLHSDRETFDVTDLRKKAV